MVSKFAAIQQQLEKAGAATSKGVTKKVVPIREPEAEAVSEIAAPAASKVQQNRIGKIHIGGYFSRDVKKSLLLVRAQTGKSEQELLAEALNDLFRAHNVPVIGG